MAKAQNTNISRYGTDKLEIRTANDHLNDDNNANCFMMKDKTKIRFDLNTSELAHSSRSSFGSADRILFEMTDRFELSSLISSFPFKLAPTFDEIANGA